ncbi:MAG TPA: hypothetical protein GYA08_03905 [Chloroflexi bacterium]|nr:hypothetical protein [Chloroflexota bacterium]
MRTIILLMLAMLLSLPGGSAALAQTDAGGDVAPAAFLTMNLKAGFPLDPFVVSLNGGGEVAASTLDETCVGFIPATPSFTVNWEGEVDAFDVFYYSDFDPTLVVQLPDGSYLCNDDASDTLLDPEVTIEAPAVGQYNLWVGSYDKGQLIPGFLVITANRTVSVNDFDPGVLVKRSPIADEVQPADVVGADAVQAALTGESAESDVVAASRAAGQSVVPDVELMGGDTPITATLVANGETPVFTVIHEDDNGIVCSGLVSGAAPEFIFRYSGDASALRVFFEGEADTSLIVVGEQVVLCSDDSAAGENANPVIDVPAPAGLYGVWVGRFDPTIPVTGTLTIVEETDTTPVQLAPMAPSANATATP